MPWRERVWPHPTIIPSALSGTTDTTSKDELATKEFALLQSVVATRVLLQSVSPRRALLLSVIAARAM
jgi:hypothetical protein